MYSATLYTVGHSNRSLDEFLALLQEAGVDTLVDVRAVPESKRYPHFSQAVLREALDRTGIVYHWAGRQLGGMREAQPGSPHIALKEESMRAYADHIGSESFQKGAQQLIGLARRSTLALLCAERLPENCHRSLLSDYLTLQGVRVVHLIAPGEQREHLLNPAARRESVALVYDRQVSGELDFGEG